MAQFEGMRTELLDWYRTNKRELPWRETNSAYHIWLSEIILQQTRIDQGLSYYQKFVEAYPTVENLAQAPEDEVLKLWQGLGYYSRARNLHSSAQKIAAQYSGKFPDTYEEIIKLKGVGEYTAAAIASIAYKLPHAAVDGNVYRVLSRLFAIDTPIDSTKGKKQFKELAQELLDPIHPGDHNQAMMEFGSLQCTPKSPDCANCVLINYCMAAAEKSVDRLPVKQGRINIRHRYFNYIISENEQEVLIQKRNGNDIWQNLYEFPLLETESKTELQELPLEQLSFFSPDTDSVTAVSDWRKQVLSHQHIHYRFITIQTKFSKNLGVDLKKVQKKDIFDFAVPKPIERKIESLNWA